MSNPLTDALPAKVRKYLYAAYAWAGVGIGATVAGFAAVGEDQPKALIVIGAVYAFLGVPLGAVAASNVDSGGETHRPIESPH